MLVSEINTSMIGMRKIDVLLDAYGANYQTDLSRKIHYMCLSAILFGFLGLVYSIPVYRLFTSIFEPSVTKHINLASVLVVFATLYYLSLSIKLAVSMLFLLLSVLAVIHIIELINLAPLWLVMGIIFVLAWMGQFLWHRYEGKKLSCFAGVQSLLIGPAWTLRQLYSRLGMRL